jgi:site-specific recombinase XerD
MQDLGMSTVTIEQYRRYYFPIFIQYCQQNGINQFSDNLYTDYNKYISNELRLNNIHELKYLRLKRSIELIKEYYSTGTMILRNCHKYKSINNPFACYTDKEEFLDLNNIAFLIKQTYKELEKFNLKQSTYYDYRIMGFNPIYRLHLLNNLSIYSPELTNQFVQDCKNRHINGEYSRKRFRIVFKTAHYINEIYNNREIKIEYFSYTDNYVELIPEYKLILENYNKYELSIGKISEFTIKNNVKIAHEFLLQLSYIEIVPLKNLTHSIINNCMLKLLESHKKSSNILIYAMRKFLKYLFMQKIIKVDLSNCIISPSRTRKEIFDGFSDEFIQKLLAGIDLPNSISKRNYAIIQLASQTGLRASDIVNLKLNDINWHLNEIAIVQQKTDKPLILPLLVQSGNAIADYILNWRPKSEIPYIFLKENPVLKLSPASLNGMLNKYVKILDLYNIAPRKCGFHSFRRSFGKSLLESEIPVDLIKELLGHSQLNSIKPYISIDELGLKHCALSLIQITGDNDK